MRLEIKPSENIIFESFFIETYFFGLPSLSSETCFVGNIFIRNSIYL